MSLRALPLLTRSRALAVAALTMLQNLPRASALDFKVNLPSSTDIQLDLVGLLTVIGEAAMEIHSQTITVSRFCLIPRIIPAPQAFLTPMRPTRLPPNTDVITVGVKSGNVCFHLNYFADLLHDVDDLDEYEVREVRVAHNPDNRSAYVYAAKLSPVTILAVLGAICTLGLLGFAVSQSDPMAILALGLLAITSTLTGYGCHWKMGLQVRTENRKVPPGDVIIKTGRGGFVLVRCTEEVARELYFGQEKCEYYWNERGFRVCAGLGTFTLMAAVVALANCQWYCQAAIGLTYIILNALYWFAAVLPARLAWDLTLYTVETEGERWQVKHKNYTGALTDLVKRTKTTGWGREFGIGIVPTTRVWMRWLDDAEAAADDEKWNGGQRLGELFRLNAADNLPGV